MKWQVKENIYIYTCICCCYTNSANITCKMTGKVLHQMLNVTDAVFILKTAVLEDILCLFKRCYSVSKG